MLKPMPLQLLEVIRNPIDFNLDDFFGFLKVEVYCPVTCKRPMLPLKHDGKTIYPTDGYVFL